MATLTLTITMSGAAFEDNLGGEAARLLEDAAQRIQAGRTTGALFDYNGNHVGAFQIGE